MHSPEFIKLIKEAALSLDIQAKCISDNWAIQLSKGNEVKFIVGYTMPLNDSTCFKIARNKNLCSEILTINKIPNVPHQLILNPLILQKRKVKQGNYVLIQNFVSENGFPLVVKKNNSSKGEGVYFINSEPALENVLSKVYATDISLCLSPYRQNAREFRNVILDGHCVLSYEKIIPFIIGDGRLTAIDLISKFIKENNLEISKPTVFFESPLSIRLDETPKEGEKHFLHWKHNRVPGMKYEVVDNFDISQLAVNAAKSINGRFVSVDIILSKKYGFEVLEINSSVGIHYPIYYPGSQNTYNEVPEIYKLALKKIFD